ncbi:MAG: pilus assembly protein TadG-related protein [Pirellulales bacterium]
MKRLHGPRVRLALRSRWAWRMLRRRAARLHGDQRGSISIASVFALLLLVMLLGMVMNSSRQIDQKVRLQNAADSATWSSGQVLVRNMNSLAFTNHLLADTFALTAFMREARDRNAESYTERIMNNWERIGPFLATSEFPPFARLGSAITQKTPHEREMATSYGRWAAAASEMTLPVLEEVLATEAIPEYQRALADATPLLVQQTAQEVARRHGQAWPRRSSLYAVVWRTRVDPIGGMQESDRRTLPAVDPSPYASVTGGSAALQPQYFRAAVDQRRRLAHRYLADWNNESLLAFDRFGKMSQFATLWRNFTCGYLEQLLNVEYPDRNLPFQIRSRAESPGADNDYLEEDFMFVGVVYQRQPNDFVPGVFKNPAAFDRQAFAQIEMFVPRRRLVRVRPGQDSNPQGMSLGGVPGGFIILPPDPSPPPPPPSDDPPAWIVVRQGGGWHPDSWDLLTQNWAVQLTPSTTQHLREILSAPPYVNNVGAGNVPNWGSLSTSDIGNLTHH